MIYLLDFRGKDVGGPVLPGKIVQSTGYGPLGTENDLRGEPKVTFLIHGYNVSRPDGRGGLTRLSQRLLAAQDGAIVCVLWPGDHWSGVASYPFEGKDADDSASELSRFIERVIKPGTELNFVSHSMGGRVLMGTLKRLVVSDYPIRQTCLMAAAIDDFSLASSEDYRAATASAERVAVLASKKDNVLRFAYPLGDFFQAIFFREDKNGLALGFHGPKTWKKNPIPEQVYHFQIPDSRGSDHGHYIPGEKPNKKEADNQRSAAKFADEVLAGETKPKYK